MLNLWSSTVKSTWQIPSHISVRVKIFGGNREEKSDLPISLSVGWSVDCWLTRCKFIHTGCLSFSNRNWMNDQTSVDKSVNCSPRSGVVRTTWALSQRHSTTRTFLDIDDACFSSHPRISSLRLEWSLSRYQINQRGLPACCWTWMLLLMMMRVMKSLIKRWVVSSLYFTL